MWADFKSFLIKANALALAIAVVIGTALNGVVQALVDGLIMPIVAAVGPDPSRYQSMEWVVGGVHFKPGLLLGALINFLIIGFVAWRLAKLFLRESPPAPAKPVKSCPFCRMGDLDPAASRCPHCTSVLAMEASAGAAPSLANTGAYLR